MPSISMMFLPPLGAAALSLSAALALAGCVSHDPSVDRSVARKAVADRTGLDPSWSSNDVTAPWESALSAEDAVRLALAGNPALRREVLTIDEARATLAQESTPPNPTIDLMLGTPLGGPGGTAVFAAAMQQLGWLVTRASRLSAAEARLRASALAAADAAVVLVAEVRERHLAIVALEESLDVAASAARSYESLVTATRAAVDSGSATQAEFAEIEAAAAAAHRTVARTEAALIEAKAQLAVAVGLPQPSATWSSDRVWPTLDLGSEGVDAAAAETRLDVLAAEALVAAADSECEAVGLEPWGQVELGIAYDRQTMDTAEEATLGPALSVAIPLFDRGGPAGAAALAAREKAAWSARERRLAAREELLAAKATRQRLLDAWRNGSQRAADRLRVAADIARSQFHAGLQSAAEVAKAEAALAEARLDAIEDRREASVAAIRLDRSRGPTLDAGNGGAS